MNIPTKETYSELYSILNMMGEEYINKLPPHIYARIENERDTSYNPTYVKDIELEKQNVSQEAIASIAYFNLNFWSETIEEKAILNKLFAQEEKTSEDVVEEQEVIEENKVETQENKQKEDVQVIENEEDNITNNENEIVEEISQNNNVQEIQEQDNQNEEIENSTQEEMGLIIHKENFFTRIINKIKEFFSRRKEKRNHEENAEEEIENITIAE